MAIEKYWTSMDGVVGTAHRNREGVEVNFQPLKSISVVGSPERNREGMKLKLSPTKGQGFPIEIAPFKVEREVLDRNEEKGAERVKYVLFAHFVGQEVTATFGPREENYDLAKVEERRTAGEKTVRKHQEKVREMEEFALGITEEQIVNFPYGARAFGRLIAGTRSCDVLVKAAIDALVAEHYKELMPLTYWCRRQVIEKFTTSGIREKILEAEEGRRKKKKEEWLATHSS